MRNCGNNEMPAISPSGDSDSISRALTTVTGVGEDMPGCCRIREPVTITSSTLALASAGAAAGMTGARDARAPRVAALPVVRRASAEELPSSSRDAPGEGDESRGTIATVRASTTR